MRCDGCHKKSLLKVRSAAPSRLFVSRADSAPVGLGCGRRYSNLSGRGLMRWSSSTVLRFHAAVARAICPDRRAFAEPSWWLTDAGFRRDGIVPQPGVVRLSSLHLSGRGVITALSSGGHCGGHRTVCSRGRVPSLGAICLDTMFQVGSASFLPRSGSLEL
jgi:hypothetical protein